MDYKQIISYLFPTAIFGTDYTLYFPWGGTTPEIKNWNTAKLGAEPTVNVLEQAWDSVLVQQARVVQLALIATASAAAQTSGFTSAALGSAYSYPSSAADQTNLTAVVTGSMIPGQPGGTTYLFWCKSAAGVENFVAHTAAQIQQVGLDGLAAIMAQKSKQLTLSGQIQAATTIAGVQSIAW